jgi:peptidase S41-like protein
MLNWGLLMRCRIGRVLMVLWLVAMAAVAQEPSVYVSDLESFVVEMDEHYPFFELKGIRPEWEATKARLLESAGACANDTAFLGLVGEAILCLRDAHMGIVEADAPMPPRPARYYPGIGFMPASGERVVVMWRASKYGDALRPGTVVTEIDGESARAYLEARAKDAWAAGGYPSPQRARLFAYRLPLVGEEGAKHRLTYLQDGEEYGVLLVADQEARGWPHTYNLQSGLRRVGRSAFFGQLDSGVLYVYLRRVDQSVAPGFAQAMVRHPDARGCIVDLRGNGGGGYDQALVSKLSELPRPVAVIIDAGCVSAGETLARDLAREANARLFGSRTAGSSSSKRTWTFPSGIASVRMSTKSRWRNDGEPIEYNGIEPDVPGEALPEDVVAGMNTGILRAEAYILGEVEMVEKQGDERETID